MKSTKEKIEVMQAFLDGKTIEVYTNDGWQPVVAPNPCWNWLDMAYRIKSSPVKVPLELSDWTGGTWWVRNSKETEWIQLVVAFKENYVELSKGAILSTNQLMISSCECSCDLITWTPCYKEVEN